jgi:hypothetical protein
MSQDWESLDAEVQAQAQGLAQLPEKFVLILRDKAMQARIRAHHARINRLLPSDLFGSTWGRKHAISLLLYEPLIFINLDTEARILTTSSVFFTQVFQRGNCRTDENAWRRR